MTSVTGYPLGYSPGHMLQCCTPAMGRSEGAAMPQNRVQCASLKDRHAQYFAPDLGISQLFIIRFSNGFQHYDRF